MGLRSKRKPKVKRTHKKRNNIKRRLFEQIKKMKKNKNSTNRNINE